MTAWYDYLKEQGHDPDWQYPVHFDKEQDNDADVLIIGGGIAGYQAVISNARQGLKVALMEKGGTAYEVYSNYLEDINSFLTLEYVFIQGKISYKELLDSIKSQLKYSSDNQTGYFDDFQYGQSIPLPKNQ